MGTRSGGEQSERTLPQSMRHQRILDLAAEQPHASMESIAEDVPSASVELVEYVLDEYGDPINDAAPEPHTAAGSDPDSQAQTESVDDNSSLGPNTQSNANRKQADDVDSGHEQKHENGREWEPEQAAENDGVGEFPQSSHENPEAAATATELTHPLTQARDVDASSSDHDLPQVAELTEGQREVLRLVAERPGATQREIANRLDVSASTVSNRANAIEGFEWQHRKQAIETFRNRVSDQTPMHESMSTNETGPMGKTDRLEERIDTLERQIASTQSSTYQPLDLDPELLQKIVHACFKSETFSQEEELDLLKLFLPEDT